MEYYYLGTENWWWVNWNHLVCRRSKCEVDHPSQSTVVNLGRKQKWCSLWCPWSQVQQDTSGPDNFRILGCLWTIHHRCTCKWDWTEMLNVSFPLRAKTVWNPLRMNTERCQQETIHDWLRPFVSCDYLAVLCIFSKRGPIRVTCMWAYSDIHLICNKALISLTTRLSTFVLRDKLYSTG